MVDRQCVYANAIGNGHMLVKYFSVYFIKEPPEEEEVAIDEDM